MHVIIYLVQVRIRTEVLRTPSSTQVGFELMTSWSWQYISCHWDACSNHLAISDSLIIHTLDYSCKKSKQGRMQRISIQWGPKEGGEIYFTFPHILLWRGKGVKILNSILNILYAVLNVWNALFHYNNWMFYFEDVICIVFTLISNNNCNVIIVHDIVNIAHCILNIARGILNIARCIHKTWRS